MGIAGTRRFLAVAAIVLAAAGALLHSTSAEASSCPQGYANDYGECMTVPMTPFEYGHNIGNNCSPPDIGLRLFSEAEALARAEYHMRCFHELGTTWRLCSLDIQAAGDWQTTHEFDGRVMRAKRPYTQTVAIRVGPGQPCNLPQTFEFNLSKWSDPYCPATWKANFQGPGLTFCYRGVKPEACTIGNPVQPATGAKLHTETDYRAAGPLPLEIKRHYRSDGNFVAVGTTDRATSMGRSWRLSYDRWVSRSTLPDASRAYVVGEDGDYREFVLSGGVWTPRADMPERLIEMKDGGGATTGWQYRRADDSTEHFGPTGRLNSITSRSGLGLAMSYDGLGRLVQVTDSFGRSILLAHDSEGRLNLAIDASGQGYAYAYDVEGNLESVDRVSPGAFKVRYVYDSKVSGSTGQRYLLTGIVDENGVRTATYAYNAQDRVTTIDHAGVYSHSFFYTLAWNNFSSSTVVVDPLGTSRTYGIASVNKIGKDAGVTQPCPTCGQSANTVTYDANGNVASRTDFNGRKVCYTYDLARNLETVRVEGILATESCPTALATPPARPDVRKVTTTWHATYRLPLVIAEPATGGNGKRTTTHTYVAGNLTQKIVTGHKNDGTTSNTSRTWKWSYGTFGRVLTSTDPNNKVTVTAYYADNDPDLGRRGNVRSISNPKGHVTTFDAYDANGHAVRITDPNGLVTTMTYHPRGWLAQRVVGQESTTYEYDAVGQLKLVTLADGSTLAYDYDAARRMTQVADGSGNRVSYTLDAMGNRVREDVYDPDNTLARTRSRAFDPLSRLAADIGAQSQATSYLYDSNGNRTRSTDPLARQTNSTYDALNRLLKEIDPAGGMTEYGYDAGGNLASVRDPRSLVTTYVHDGLGNQTRQVSPDTGTTSRTFDAAGNIRTSVDARGVTATYAYDVIGRVTRLVYSQTGKSSETHAFEYDGGATGALYGKGRLTKLTDPAAITTWTHTAHGRIASAAQKVGSLVQTVVYGYDIAGQRASLITPSGQTVTYAYANGRIAGVKVNDVPLIASTVHEPFGPPAGWRWGNAALTIRDYDADGRMAGWSLDDGATTERSRTLYRSTLTWDLANRITAISDPARPAVTGAFGYDVLDRLNLAQIGTPVGLTQQFGYDAVGNRTHLTVDGAHTNYAYGTHSNQLLALTGAISRSYIYDGAGNPTQVSGRTATYNLANRLTTIVNGATMATYKVNGLGQRISKTVAGTTTRFVYDDLGRLLGEYDSAGKLIQETIWLEDLPIATLRPTGASGTPTPVNIYHVHPDHLGSPRAITRRSDNAFVWRWDNVDPFGANAANENPAGLGTFRYALRFPGQYYDGESGTHYNYFRDYDPAIGRYIQSDPIGLQGGINTYSYVLNNPLAYADPFGLDVTVCFYADAAAGFGHVGFSLPGESMTQGFYPTGNPLSSPGDVKPDAQQEKQCKVIDSPTDKDQCMLQCRARRDANPGQYRLTSRQCTSFVRDCLKECGLPSGTYSGPRPNPFYQGLPGKR